MLEEHTASRVGAAASSLGLSLGRGARSTALLRLSVRGQGQNLQVPLIPSLPTAGNSRFIDSENRLQPLFGGNAVGAQHFKNASMLRRIHFKV